MTSRGPLVAPAAGRECPGHLLEEVIRADPETEHRQSENHIGARGDLVVPDCVLDKMLRPGVLDAVDFDDDTPSAPPSVEEVAACSRPTHDLQVRLRKSAFATPAHKVELPERSDPARKVDEHAVDVCPASVPAYPQHLDRDVLRPAKALLDSHGQQQRSLTIARCPQSGPNGCHRRSTTRNAAAQDIIGLPAACLPQVNARAATALDPSTLRDRHPNRGRCEVLESGGNQSRCTVQEGSWSPFEERHPPARHRRQGAAVKGDSVASYAAPSPGAHMGTDLSSSDAHGIELAAGHDALLEGREISDRSHPFGKSAPVRRHDTQHQVKRCVREMRQGVLCTARAARPAVITKWTAPGRPANRSLGQPERRTPRRTSCGPVARATRTQDIPARPPRRPPLRLPAVTRRPGSPGRRGAGSRAVRRARWRPGSPDR